MPMTYEAHPHLKVPDEECLRIMQQPQITALIYSVVNSTYIETKENLAPTALVSLYKNQHRFPELAF